MKEIIMKYNPYLPKFSYLKNNYLPNDLGSEVRRLVEEVKVSQLFARVAITTAISSLAQIQRLKEGIIEASEEVKNAEEKVAQTKDDLFSMTDLEKATEFMSFEMTIPSKIQVNPLISAALDDARDKALVIVDEFNARSAELQAQEMQLAQAIEGEAKIKASLTGVKELFESSIAKAFSSNAKWQQAEDRLKVIVCGAFKEFEYSNKNQIEEIDLRKY